MIIFVVVDFSYYHWKHKTNDDAVSDDMVIHDATAAADDVVDGDDTDYHDDCNIDDDYCYC